MARYSRESRLRAIKEGNRPPLMCPNCGQNFWNAEQKQAHIGISAGKSYCQYAPVGPKPVPMCGYCQDRPSSLLPCPECDS